MRPLHFILCLAAFLVTYYAALNPDFVSLTVALFLTASVGAIPTLDDTP